MTNKPREFWIAKVDPNEGKVFDKDPRTFLCGTLPNSVTCVVPKEDYLNLVEQNAILREQLNIYRQALIAYSLDEKYGYVSRLALEKVKEME